MHSFGCEQVLQSLTVLHNMTTHVTFDPLSQRPLIRRQPSQMLATPHCHEKIQVQRFFARDGETQELRAKVAKKPSMDLYHLSHCATYHATQFSTKPCPTMPVTSSTWTT